MRIGIYYHNLCEVGGGVRVIANLIKIIKKLDYTPLILTNSYCEFIENVFPIFKETENIEIKTLPNFLVGWSKGIRKYLRAGINIVNSYKFVKNIKNLYLDIIILVDSYYLSYFVTKYTNISAYLYVMFPYSLTYKSSFNEVKIGIKRKFLINIEKIFMKNADKILCISKFVQEVIKDYFDANSEILYEAIDTNKFYPDWNLKEDKVILAVSRFHPYKKIDVMVKLFRELTKYHDDTKFFIAGGLNRTNDLEIKYFKTIKNMTNNVDNIKLVANPTDEKLVELYQKATIFWHLKEEHHILTPLEAMACGAVPIILKQRGADGLTHLENGIMAKSYNEFIEWSAKLLEDDELRYKLAKNGVETIKNTFSIEALTEKFKEILEEVE